MKESIPTHKTAAQMSRRNFIGGLLAGIGITQANAEDIAPETSIRPLPRPIQFAESVETGDIKEHVYATYQPLASRVAEHTSMLQTDAEVVIGRAERLVELFDGYESMFALVRAELPISAIQEPTQSALREIMSFVPYVESRFDPEAVSPLGAFGIMQLMPRTWNELATEDEDTHNLIDQVKVAGRLLEQTYRYLHQRHAETFELVTHLVFAGDAERCAKEFVAPAILTAYFCGMGSVANVLDGFVHDYIDPEDVERMQQQGIVSEDYGVFSLFSHAGEVHNYDRNFGSEAAQYFAKALAAQMAVRVNVPSARYDALLHHSTEVL